MKNLLLIVMSCQHPEWSFSFIGHSTLIEVNMQVSTKHSTFIFENSLQRHHIKVSKYFKGAEHGPHIRDGHGEIYLTKYLKNMSLVFPRSVIWRT